MKRIAIIGSGGSGKSTFAAQLAVKLKLPIYHLDAYYWKPNWTPTPNEQWDEVVKGLAAKDEWIIDGNYSRTLDIRLNRADTIIFFDLPRLVTTYRVVKRRIMYHGKTRPDLNKDCPEQLDWEFIKWVWNFKRDKRPQIMKRLDEHKDKQIIIFKQRQEIKDFLNTL